MELIICITYVTCRTRKTIKITGGKGVGLITCITFIARITLKTNDNGMKRRGSQRV